MMKKKSFKTWGHRIIYDVFKEVISMYNISNNEVVNIYVWGTGVCSLSVII